MGKITKCCAFWILVVLIVVSSVLIWFGIGNELVVYGILAGLVTGFVIKVLDWITC